MPQGAPAKVASKPADGAAPGATLAVTERPDALVLSFRGHLDLAAAASLWAPALRAGRAARGRTLQIDLSGLESCDTTGATLLLKVAGQGDAAGRTTPADMTGAGPQVTAILARARDALRPTDRPSPAPPLPWRTVILGAFASVGDAIAYLGEALTALVVLPGRLRQFRALDLLRTADQAGVRAVPLVLLLGLLMGLILAFQSLLPMRRFGADIYVANLVAISLLRELGPLLAAVVLAGRSGSAFAAEIGTMKVNQEIDALVTMGVDPMTTLVLPRLLAAMLVMPVLTVLLEIAGLIGMSVVLVGAGIPLVAISHQIIQWVRPRDFYGGMVKAVVFGAVVAAIGCRQGLAAGSGPRAVGLAATAAVVGGIVSTIGLDGLFAVLFYRLGL
jgi:phospholipid/cholesterol/gamma-HCH transport system permease protein